LAKDSVMNRIETSRVTPALCGVSRIAYFLPGAQAVKSLIAKPVVLVGGIRSLSKVEEVLESGAADFVSMSRPFIRQPDLPNLWLSGEGPDKAACISCNACLPIGESPTQCNALK
jgi:2,4-dienoyl-CoA reductase-like NADH-dependent reductase (Old Yellow Enzyme family)